MAESWSATRYTAPVRVKEYFKDRTGPACRMITYGSSGLWPLRAPRTARELNVTEAFIVINPSNDNQMVQIC